MWMDAQWDQEWSNAGPDQHDVSEYAPPKRKVWTGTLYSSHMCLQAASASTRACPFPLVALSSDLQKQI